MARRRPNRLRSRNSKGRPPVLRETVATDELLAHRQRVAPNLTREDLMKQRAGVPIEVLLVRRFITEAQRSAGEQYGELVRSWRRLHSVPDGRLQPSRGISNADPDPRTVRKVAAEMEAVQAELARSTTALARAAIETVCVDEEIGRILDQTVLGERLRAHLIDGLDSLCVVFRVRKDRAA